MMYTYRIALTSYEEYHPIELLHKNKFTRDEIIEMYCSCIEEVYLKLFEDFKNVERIYSWDMKLESYVSMFHSELMDIFIKKFGFEKVKYKVDLGIWSFINDDPNENVRDYNKGLIKIKHKLVNLAELHKERLRKEILETREAKGLSNIYEDEEEDEN